MVSCSRAKECVVVVLVVHIIVVITVVAGYNSIIVIARVVLFQVCDKVTCRHWRRINIMVIVKTRARVRKIWGHYFILSSCTTSISVMFGRGKDVS